MSLKHTTLIVDDHPITLETYTTILRDVFNEFDKFNSHIITAENCDSANYHITQSNNLNPIDLAIIDLRIPPSDDHELVCGEDLCHKLKSKFKKIKIIIITAENDNYRLYNILRTISPISLLIKSDINFKMLQQAFKLALNDLPFYSSTVNTLIRAQLSNQIHIDDVDRSILYHIAQGTKTKDLPELINLSIGGIEKRKRILRDVFNTPQKDDKRLIECARQKGII